MAAVEGGLKQALWGGPGAVLEWFPCEWGGGVLGGGDGTLRKAASFPEKFIHPHVFIFIFFFY